MGLRINNNVEAFNTHRLLNANSKKLSKSMEKLSSGFRINSGADDAAGLRISERLRGQISGLAQAQRNAADGMSYAATADGALGEIQSMLHRVRELAVQYNNGTNDVAARTAISAEAQALNTEIGRIITSTTFNGVAVINNGGAITLQVGANNLETTVIPTVNATATMTTAAINTGFPLAGTAQPAGTITLIDDAINTISGFRGTFGAVSNRLEYTQNALGIAQENMMAAESRLRDVDMAAEMAKMTKFQILQESGMAMLAQANQQGSSVLSLLR